MLLKNIILSIAGFSCGGVVAGGIFAFLAVIGIFPRLIGKTGTKQHILFYETAIILGGTAGNALDLFEFPIPVGTPLLLLITGGTIGCFVGCLFMSLAETLKAIPVICRRLYLSVGLQYMILGMALGKTLGSLYYYFLKVGA